MPFFSVKTEEEKAHNLNSQKSYLNSPGKQQKVQGDTEIEMMLSRCLMLPPRSELQNHLKSKRKAISNLNNNFEVQMQLLLQSLA